MALLEGVQRLALKIKLLHDQPRRFFMRESGPRRPDSDALVLLCLGSITETVCKERCVHFVLHTLTSSTVTKTNSELAVSTILTVKQPRKLNESWKAVVAEEMFVSVLRSRRSGTGTRVASCEPSQKVCHSLRYSFTSTKARPETPGELRQGVGKTLQEGSSLAATSRQTAARGLLVSRVRG